MKTLLLIALVALVVCPAGLSLRATGGYYDDNGFYAAGDPADPCAEHGGTVTVRDGTTGIGDDPETGKPRWFHTKVHTCEDGTEVSVKEWLTFVDPFAGYEATPPGDPPPPCVEAHYTDDPENPWDEGTC